MYIEIKFKKDLLFAIITTKINVEKNITSRHLQITMRQK